MPIHADQLQGVMETEHVVARDLGRNYAYTFDGVQDGETLHHAMIRVDGDGLNILYREAAIQSMMADQRFSTETPIATLSYALAGIIVNWDLVGDDGERLAITPATLETLGQAVLLNLWYALAVSELASSQ